MTTPIRKLIREFEELYFLEFGKKINYNESNDDPDQMFVSLPDTEEIFLPDAEEYVRVLQALYTWLEHAPQFVKNKFYIRKEIQTTEYDDAYMYTFKKQNKNEYILVNKKELE